MSKLHVVPRRSRAPATAAGVAQARLRELHKQEAAITREIRDIIPRAFPVGASITWLHGNNSRTAEVINHAFDRVKVRGQKGREYWVYAWNLLQSKQP